MEKCDCEKQCIDCGERSSAFNRLLEEKNNLDDKIFKLKQFLAKYEKANAHEELVKKVGSQRAADELYHQLEIEIELSNILNTRIILWED